jgi:hypothetical protein
MRPTRLLRALPVTLAFTFAVSWLANAAHAQDAVNAEANPADELADATAAAWLDGTPLDLSTPELDASKFKSIDPWHGAPSALQSKVGVDYRKPTMPATEFQPEQLLAGAVPNQSAGVAWANVSAPGLDAPFGWDKTTLETRLDPDQDQGKFGTTLSRSVPVGTGLSVTLQNGLAVTRTLPSPAQPSSQVWASSQALQFNLLPTDTTVSLGGEFSTADDRRWLPTLSAEQKLFGGPFSLTGSLSETASGETSKSLKAGFKRTW